MLSSVLRSKTAIAVNIEIMRAFVELRRVANSYAAIEERLEQIERGMGEHDEQLEQVFRPSSADCPTVAAKAANWLQGPRGRGGAKPQSAA